MGRGQGLTAGSLCGGGSGRRGRASRPTPGCPRTPGPPLDLQPPARLAPAALPFSPPRRTAFGVPQQCSTPLQLQICAASSPIGQLHQSAASRLGGHGGGHPPPKVTKSRSSMSSLARPGSCTPQPPVLSPAAGGEAPAAPPQRWPRQRPHVAVPSTAGVTGASTPQIVQLNR